MIQRFLKIRSTTLLVNNSALPLIYRCSLSRSINQHLRFFESFPLTDESHQRFFSKTSSLIISMRSIETTGQQKNDQTDRPNKLIRLEVNKQDQQSSNGKGSMDQITVNSNISLEPSESELFRSLRESVDQIRFKVNDQTSLELRVAGGWVRDKLLGVQSKDLDIAVSSLTGLEFAELFSDYLRGRGKEKCLRGNRSDDDEEEDEDEKIFRSTIDGLGRISTIEARPDQSKHLQTVTTKFLGMDLDFVQLRSEEYSEDSRIPTSVTFGTPLEDASRRDITINALFYNIHTGLIEDPIGRGLEDLKLGIIRTPLEAHQTFKDDPLRLIRCIRFSTRFGFKLDQQIDCAARSESIRNALREKISRERIGTELEKMLKGPDPYSSVKMIIDLGLYPLIFCKPDQTTTDQESGDLSLVIRSSKLLKYLAGPKKETVQKSSGYSEGIESKDKKTQIVDPLLLRNFNDSDVIKKRLYLGCCLIPFKSIFCKARKKSVWAGELVISESLKFGNHDKIFIANLFRSIDLIEESSQIFDQGFLNQDENDKVSIHSNHGDKEEGGDEEKTYSGVELIRLTVGRLIRNPIMHDLKQIESQNSTNYLNSLLFSLIYKLTITEEEEERDKIIESYNRLISKIFELDLQFILTNEFDKSRLDGNEICKILEIRPSKILSEIIEDLTTRMIVYPNLSKSQQIEFLKSKNYKI
ncbi:tRNA nucleotidyltransferase [Phakopsora pachyrhizi]|uniref:tRNA nucleotidyltransferase n=1 Tax=Phakopsora pachyrhizi TaxID=170000 RepID=A0AAV0BTT0_PHAPC|nr:tRNA nucleotidyltransferase [Phakopsora pachyrhizi]